MRVAAALSYLFPPLLMVFLWFRFVEPGDAGPVFEAVFLAFFLVFCWFGVGWFVVGLRRALGRGSDGD